MQSLAVEYKKLEDEFRDALKIEERRYHEVNPSPLLHSHLSNPLSAIQNQRNPSKRERTSSIILNEYQTTRRIRSKDGQ